MEKEDRRIRRSRKLLKQGLLELMRGKKFSEISVRDITDLVDMNRGTFYLHYPDTSALLKSIEQDIEDEVQELIEAHLQETAEANSMRPLFEPVLNYIIDNKEMFDTFVANAETSHFFDRMCSACKKNGTRIIELRFPSLNEKDRGYFMNYVIYGLIGLIRTWFEDGMEIPKEELLDLADRMVFGSAKGMM